MREINKISFAIFIFLIIVISYNIVSVREVAVRAERTSIPYANKISLRIRIDASLSESQNYRLLHKHMSQIQPRP